MLLLVKGYLACDQTLNRKRDLSWDSFEIVVKQIPNPLSVLSIKILVQLQNTYKVQSAKHKFTST